MRLLPLLSALPLLLGGCIAAHEGRDASAPEAVRSAEQAILEGLGVFDGTAKKQPRAVLDDLRDQQDDAEGNDKAWIDALLPVVEKVVDAPSTVKADDYRTVADVMDKFAAAHPDEFEIQIQAATGLWALERTLRALPDGPGPNEDGPMGTSALRRARAVATQFPDKARAHAHLGNVVAASGGDALLAMRSYARCMQLDPQIATCKTGFKSVAEDYQRPKCAAVDKKKLGLHPAVAQDAAKSKGKKKPKAPAGTKAVQVDKAALYMDAKAALDGSDVGEVTEVDAGGSDGKQIELWLTPKAAGTFSDLTAKLAKAQSYLVVVIDGKPVAAPRVMSAIDSGHIRLNAAGIDLKKLCSKWDRRRLPPDLQRVAEGV